MIPFLSSVSGAKLTATAVRNRLTVVSVYRGWESLPTTHWDASSTDDLLFCAKQIDPLIGSVLISPSSDGTSTAYFWRLDGRQSDLCVEVTHEP